MGNTCCLRSRVSQNEDKSYNFDGQGQYTRNHTNEFHHQSMTRDDTTTTFLRILPHISEREIPEEDYDDPSTHPTAQPTFMERSQSEVKLRYNRRSCYMLDAIAAGTTFPGVLPQNLRKSSSCSTIYLDDSTLSQPNLKITIKCVCLAIYYHIANRTNRGNERLMEIFEERLHPIMREPLPPESLTRDPDHRQIYRFVRTLFHSAQLTAECAIITLVYIERLLSYAEMDLCPSNWRRVVLGAIMLASKVWDDQAVWNVDYCQILRDTSVDDMNELERRFLECLDFNIEVASSVYAKYYFGLRSLALANDMQMPLHPLYKDRAKRLEATSREIEDKYIVLRRSYSDDRVQRFSRAPVVLS